MEIPPKKPHFFKPILPGFKNGLKVPIGFLKYLKGHGHVEHVVLKRAGKKWLVKLNGRRFEDGWEKFAEEHDLQLGNMLIFRHEGDMDFHVSIFDSTHCDTEYAEYLQEKKIEKPKPNVMSSNKAGPSIVETVKGLHLSHSQFVCTMKSYNLAKSFLCVPRPFAQLNGLRNRRCTIMINDKQRSWTFSLYSLGNITYIGGGWRNFCVANCLKEGDRLMFEIVINGEKPMLKFRDPRGNLSLHPKGKTTNLGTDKVSTQDPKGNESLQPERKKTNLDTYKVSTREKTNPKASRKVFPNVEVVTNMPHFICTMKSYYLSKNFLPFPNPFARLNGLRNRKCTIMIRDEQGSWMFSLYSSGRHTYIGGRWRDFCAANCLKEGDRLMFEIVSNEKKPILKFRDMRGNTSLQTEGKKTNLDATTRISNQGLKIENSDILG
ncbi:B3 domain-containing protein REM10 isoform X2 [Capsicum annuum]|uniref:B3 domain-containing protein REM10 isoform X2 n=1 Tax=Capsicum annuum TaxID=4072 RepID=UPI0007BF96CD|nr:B3 domain-containing protein REM10 isoform X2 [Capsicum annuum]